MPVEPTGETDWKASYTDLQEHHAKVCGERDSLQEQLWGYNQTIKKLSEQLSDAMLDTELLVRELVALRELVSLYTSRGGAT